MANNSDAAVSRAPSRRAWLLLAFVLLNGFAINLALPRLPLEPQHVTTLDYTAGFFSRVAHGDSWKAMRTALFYTDAPRAKPLYTAVYFDNNVRFQYPPSSLLVLDALRAIGGQDAILDPALNGISWWCAIAMAPLLIRIFQLARRRFDGQGGSNPASEVVYAIAIVLALFTFYPVVRGYYLGQIQVWIDLLLTAVVWAWLEGRRSTAGALLACICVIKPTLAIVVIWGALRRQWDFIVGFAIPMSLVAIAALLVYGFENHVDYLGVLSYISRQGEIFHPNQSMNGLLHRLVGNGDSLEWERNTLIAYHAGVHAGTVISSLVLVAIGLFVARVRSTTDGVVELAIVVLCSTLAAPTVWTHHYGVTLPLFAATLPLLLRSDGGDRDHVSRTVLLGFVLAYALISNNYRVLNRLADTPFNVLQSYVYFGGLTLLGLLLAIRARRVQQRE